MVGKHQQVILLLCSEHMNSQKRALFEIKWSLNLGCCPHFDQRLSLVVRRCGEIDDRHVNRQVGSDNLSVSARAEGCAQCLVAVEELLDRLADTLHVEPAP